MKQALKRIYFFTQYLEHVQLLSKNIEYVLNREKMKSLGILVSHN
ncbi:hypothetical protein HMPREF9178_0441 [Streptococcus mitis bv. 2 str. F0392]|uniref:Uncharacterized protein n=1 Tax=Streptococcus mitis bv. 2 str. F0392 TaxID=768726 RepID=F9NZL4_STROR|nr:hypothetical protein HMPREF9178_0441 [Streptococcus mitis bv. 2 str. F0392]